MFRSKPAISRRLARGEYLFSCGQIGPLWKVEPGVILLMARNRSNDTPCGIARAGDVLGVEAMWGDPYSVSARALMPTSVLHAPAPTARDDIAILGTAYLTLQQRHAQFISLRSGSAFERIERLATMLGDQYMALISTTDSANRISGRDIARLLDMAEETLCRELRRWRTRNTFVVGADHQQLLAA